MPRVIVTPRSPSPSAPSAVFSASNSRSIAAVRRAIAGEQSGAVDAHPTLQKAQSQGAVRKSSSCASSLMRVKDTPAISIEVA